MDFIKRQLRDKASALLSVAPDRVAPLPRVTVSGDSEVLLECHKGILLYREDRLRAATACGDITVTGKGLTLRELTKDMLLIRGRVEGVYYG